MNFKISRRGLISLMKKLDLKCDGRCSFDELLMIFQVQLQQQNNEPDIELEVFKMFDKDGSGAISSSELGEAIKELGLSVDQQEINELVQIVDSNKSGEVDFAEFKEFV